MTKRTKSSERGGPPPAELAPVPSATAGPAVRAGDFYGVTSDSVVLGANRWSFDGVLQRVLGFSRAAEREGDGRRPGAGGERASSTVRKGSDTAATSPAFDALRLFVRSLDAETQDKLRALMRAGHEAQALPGALAAVAADRVSEGPSSPELFARGPAALQDLQRGHAVACATGFDLELELAVWATIREPESLDERVWLRFGRELAQSRIEDWACLAVVDSRDRLQKLYLRRGKSRWWSFAALIDRPSEQALRAPRVARGARTRLVVLPVEAALRRSRGKNLRALRRASMAVSARLGKSLLGPRLTATKTAAKVTT